MHQSGASSGGASATSSPGAAGGSGGIPVGGASGAAGIAGGESGSAGATGLAGEEAGVGGTAGTSAQSFAGASGTTGTAGSGLGGDGAITGTAGTAAAGGSGATAGAGGATTGAGGAACDSRCEMGEMCVQGICAGGTSRWPTLGGDLHHSGFNVNEKGTPPLTFKWSVPLAPSLLWPAVSDGNTVFVTAEETYFRQSTNLWALSPDDGHTLWSHDFGDIFGVGQATVDDGDVYVAQCDNSAKTFMYKFVASTGALSWSAPFDAQWENYWAPVVTPAGGVYFDGGEYGGLYGLTIDGNREFFNGTLEQFDQWSPLFLNTTLYSFVDGNLRTHDLMTGVVTSTVTVPWQLFAGTMRTSPVSDGSRIYLESPPTLFAFTPGQSTPDWTSDAMTVPVEVAGMPAVGNGVVYVLNGGQLRAVDASTGKTLWMFAGDSSLSYPPVVAGHWVYVASPSNVFGVDVTTQQQVWTASPGGWLSIAEGLVLVAQQNGSLTAYSLTPGP
jgi:large repetitive protein